MLSRDGVIGPLSLCFLPHVVNWELGHVHQAEWAHVHAVIQNAEDLKREWTAEEHNAMARHPASELHVLCESERRDPSSHDGQCAKHASPPLLRESGRTRLLQLCSICEGKLNLIRERLVKSLKDLR